MQFGFLVASYGVGFFLPQILQARQLSNTRIGLLTSACYACATVAMILWARPERDERTNESTLVCVDLRR